MDPERDRRNGANFLDARVAGPGTEWKDGQIQVRIGRGQPIRLDRNGDLVFEFDPDAFEVVSGSPNRLRAKPDAVIAALRAESARLVAANAALLARVAVLESAGATLSTAVSGIDARLQLLEEG